MRIGRKQKQPITGQATKAFSVAAPDRLLLLWAAMRRRFFSRPAHYDALSRNFLSRRFLVLIGIRNSYLCPDLGCTASLTVEINTSDLQSLHTKQKETATEMPPTDTSANHLLCQGQSKLCQAPRQVTVSQALIHKGFLNKLACKRIPSHIHCSLGRPFCCAPICGRFGIFIRLIRGRTLKLNRIIKPYRRTSALLLHAKGFDFAHLMGSIMPPLEHASLYFEINQTKVKHACTT